MGMDVDSFEEMVKNADIPEDMLDTFPPPDKLSKKQLGEMYAKAVKTLHNQNQLLEKVHEKLEEGKGEKAFISGTVIGVSDGKITLHTSRGELIVDQPGLDEFPDEIHYGDRLLLSSETLKPVWDEGVSLSPSLGRVMEVTDPDVSGYSVEVDGGPGGGRIVRTSRRIDDLEEGDEVVVSHPPVVALKKVRSSDDDQTVGQSQIDVTWEDIGGLDSAKETIRESVEYPHKHPEIYQAYDRDPVNGILLYGPPGTGKTMLGKATAASLADTHGQLHDSAFQYIKGPEVLNKWVGESEKNIRQLFDRARSHREKHGYPSVIFIDEADALLGNRSQRRTGSLNDTIVPAFLSEMDGIDDSGAIVILSTNHSDALDPAVTRDGRIDRKIHVGRPDKSAAREIARIHLDEVKTHGPAEDDPDQIGLDDAGSSRIGSEDLVDTLIDQLYEKDHLLYEHPEEGVVDLSDRVSGAMIAGIVDKAVASALRRDRRTGRTTASGVMQGDIVGAVRKTYRENQNVNHNHASRGPATAVSSEEAS